MKSSKRSLRELQSEFAYNVAFLILKAHSLGYQITMGDAYATSGHIEGSKHYKRLAIDINLFQDGVYLTKTSDHQELGEYWENIGGIWGGRFSKRRDGNHYEWVDERGN